MFIIVLEQSCNFTLSPEVNWNKQNKQHANKGRLCHIKLICHSDETADFLNKGIPVVLSRLY